MQCWLQKANAKTLALLFPGKNFRRLFFNQRHHRSRPALIIESAIGFDFGIQTTLVAHQTVVFGIDPASRSRLDALLFTGMFVGMASGATLGGLMLAQWGWADVVALAMIASMAALTVRMMGQRKIKHAVVRQHIFCRLKLK